MYYMVVCCGLFCLPCLACQVSTRLGENCCVPYCLSGGLLALRTKLRITENIQGTICNDGCLICCCTQLAVCQMNRELNNVGL
ncbi:hypothetical protein LSH36_316g06000 [Paralvinella palmiformis]|uniref:Uncharacterized protein n=1 Tax=Paralvinella palmiformis TaxID=53620 RepID=A0AAD9JGQ8_9ANNE|nr:hypothetical protein LSH36_316g06000 [Paralvinella palmiformis]